MPESAVKATSSHANHVGTVRACELVDSAESVLARLASEGKVTFDVAVSIKDEAGVEVATMTVTWYARRNEVRS